jgi:large repetitive protein
VLVAVTDPPRGTAVANVDGTVTYTPDAGFITGTDTFRYTVVNAHGLSDTGVVTISLDTTCVLIDAGDVTSDFSAGAGDWTVETPTPEPVGADWAVTNGEFFTQDPALGPKDDRLVSPVFNLSTASTLTFSHRFNTEDTFDGGDLEVSLDGGSTWQEITAAGGVFVSGGYTSTAAGLPAAWSGVSPSYPGNDDVVVNLAALAGINRRFRFHFVADDNTGVEGWYVDNVTVTGTQDLDCPANQAPVANAGLDFEVNEGAAAMLSGALSTDAENDVLTYAWSQLSGTAVALAGADTATPTFTAPAVGADAPLLFRLTVSDPDSLSSTDDITVTVKDLPIPPPPPPPPPRIGNNNVGASSTGWLMVLAFAAFLTRRRARSPHPHS